MRLSWSRGSTTVTSRPPSGSWLISRECCPPRWEGLSGRHPPPSPPSLPARRQSNRPACPWPEASTLVDEATDCLWGPGGQNARACLHGRGLTDETIRAAGVHARRLDPDSGWGPLLSVLRGRHSLEGRRPADPDQDPSSGRWQAEVRGSLLRSSAHLSRPGCHSTRQVSDRH